MSIPEEEPVVARLQELGIAFTRHEHPPVATVDEASAHWAGIDATHCKNLFLRNQKGNRHYLVVLTASKKADLKAVADQIGDGKLSFASPERLMTHLGRDAGLGVAVRPDQRSRAHASASCSTATFKPPRAWRFTRTSIR